MDSLPPSITTIDGKRQFACFPVAVLGILVNEREEILLMSNPDHGGGWQVVNGAMEAQESVLAAVLRETREEVGSQVKVRPLGNVQVASFHYDENVRFMLSIAFLLAFESGEVQPGDDMVGSDFRWWSLDEIKTGKPKLLIPLGEIWLLERAVALYRLWHADQVASYQGFDMSVRGKVKKSN